MVDPRLLSGLSAIDERLISRTASGLRLCLLASVPTPIYPCKPFSCKTCPGIMESRIISSENPSNSVLTVDSSSSSFVESTRSSTKVDFCSASAPSSVVTVTSSDVPKPAMVVIHTLALSCYDGAESSDGSFVNQEHVEQLDASSDELEIIEAKSVAAAAAVATAGARLRFLRAPARPPRSHRRRLVDKFCFWICSATSLAF